MEIKVSHEQGLLPVTVFHVSGPITESESLENKAREAYDDGTRNIVIDLSSVPYMASPGLRALHAIYLLLRTTAAEEADDTVRRGIVAGTYTSPHLKLVNPNKNVLEVLKMTGYDMFLEVHKNLKDAVASFHPVKTS